MNKFGKYIFLALGSLGLFSGSATANSDSDHERARAAVESGDVVPLSFILEKVETLYEGSIIEVELEDEGDDGSEHAIRGIIYEIKLLTPQGNLLKIEMDARTMELIQVKGYGEKRARKYVLEQEEEQEP